MSMKICLKAVKNLVYTADSGLVMGNRIVGLKGGILLLDL